MVNQQQLLRKITRTRSITTTVTLIGFLFILTLVAFTAHHHVKERASLEYQNSEISTPGAKTSETDLATSNKDNEELAKEFEKAKPFEFYESESQLKTDAENAVNAITTTKSTLSTGRLEQSA